MKNSPGSLTCTTLHANILPTGGRGSSGMVLVWGGEVGVGLLETCRLSGEKAGGDEEEVFGGGALFFFFLFFFLEGSGVGGVIAAYLYVDTWTGVQRASE